MPWSPGLVPRLDRRTLLLGSAGALLLVACGGDDHSDDDGSAGSVSLDPADEPNALTLGVAIPPTVLAAGKPSRVPLVLSAGTAPATDAPTTVVVDLAYLGDGRGEAEPDPVPVSEGLELTRHDEGLPGSYYPLLHTFDDAGIYRVSSTIEGSTVEAVVQVAEADQVPVLVIGDAMVPEATPTVGATRGADPICTRDPQCPFHEVTLADALATGKPVALLFSTPAYCQTAVCGPVLDLLIDESSGRDLAVVHVEVYTNGAALAETGDLNQSRLAPSMTTYGLAEAGYEPALFLASSDGTVAQRLDVMYDAVELRQALDDLS
jgi:hypothetical protein